MRIEEIGAATLVNGDCREVMRSMDENSIDAIVTDPPYGLGFMGKGWDHGVPDKEFWVEALRVAKPGAHLLAFGGSRTFHRLMVAIEDAGWEIRDTIMWVYGSGFPKSKNLEGDWKGWGTALKPAYEPVIVARKPLIGTVAANVLAHGTGAINIEGCRVGDEVLPAMTAGQAKIGTFERGVMITPERIGRWPANLIHDGSDEVLALFPDSNGSGGSLPQVKVTGYGSGVVGTGKSEYFGGPRTPHDAGSGSAARFFYCAKASRKDRDSGLDSTCTVKYDAPKGDTSCDVQNTVTLLRRATQDIPMVRWHIGEYGASITGQCQADSLSIMLMAISKITILQTSNSSAPSCTSAFIQGANSDATYGGSPAECAGNSNPLTATTGISQNRDGLCMADASPATSRLLSWVSDSTNWKPATNIHSTVKPTDLMRYLCRLVTPPGGTVLDPFMGSGSTGKAALREGFGFVGIDNDEEHGYFDIACARVKAATLPE